MAIDLAGNIRRKNTAVELVSEMKNRFPSSGELNFKVSNPANCLKILEVYMLRDSMTIWMVYP